MKINKPLYLLFSVLVLLSLVLSACAPASTPEPPVETDVPVETEAPSEPTEVVVEEPTEVPTEVPTEAPPADPLVIGVMSDLTGGLALFGNEMWEGLQLGFQYATGGTMTVAGRPIELVIKDDTSDVDVGKTAAQELIESDAAEILVGNASSAVALQVQTIADENEVVYFAAPAASPDIVGANFNEHTFRVCRNSAQDPLTVAQYALENIGQNYLILAEDYAFGQATAAAFQLTFSALGGTFLTEQPIYAASDTTDFTKEILQIKELAPDGLILIWATNTSGSILFEQLTSQGVTGTIPFITGFSSNDLTKLLDPGNAGAVGLIVYHYTLPDTEANTFLTEQYMEQFGKYPDLFSECGFATAQAIVAALEANGGDAASSALIPALEGLSFEGPKGTYTIRAEDHQALAPMYVVELVSVDDPEERFFNLVGEVSAEDTTPPCMAPTCSTP
jgi:branched-chain amino acid transport system substrate-binding protein